MLDKVATREQPASLEDVLRELRELRALVERRVGVASDDSDELSVAQVARLVHKSEQTIRNWAPNIGHYDARQRRYLVSRKRLTAYHAARFGFVPEGLDLGIL